MADYFQVSVELTKVFPVTWMVDRAAAHILSFARDLRKTGSDIVIEEDLAKIFGRGLISAELGHKFKDAVQINKITPLSGVSPISLVAGPGHTLMRALNEVNYFATVITLSMLGYYHNREQLATMLSSAMDKRHQIGVRGATSSPGKDGIMNTLAACSSQSSPFAWHFYSELIEQKLRNVVPTYKYSPDYTRLTPSLLLGAMDFLYLAQRTPEIRKITVSDQSGCIVLITWAHYILNLTVIIKGTFKGRVTFGDSKEPDVYITWLEEETHDAEELRWPMMADGAGADTIIRLHERDIEIVLTESAPEPRLRISVIAEARHPLRGYGTMYLRRLFNSDLVTRENDPIYEAFVKLVAAVAIHASRRLDRNLEFGYEFKHHEHQTLPPRKRPFHPLEAWKPMTCARLFFDGISFSDFDVEDYEKQLAQINFDESEFQHHFEPFLKKARLRINALEASSRLYRELKYLATVVMVLSHVEEIKSCADVPLIISKGLFKLESTMSQILKGPNQRATIDPYEIFYAVISLLSSTSLDGLSKNQRKLSLCSDFGWSVFLATLKDKDPADTRSERVLVIRGIPTNGDTNEQKIRIRDGTGLASDPEQPEVSCIENGSPYTPRTVAKVGKRSEYCAVQSQEFEVTLYYTVMPTVEWQKHKVEKFEAYTSYWDMHERLWSTYSTENCEHKDTRQILDGRSSAECRLGFDAAVALGWNLDGDEVECCSQKVLILLTKGEPHIRWLAVVSAALQARDTEFINREIMLRTGNCCESCALTQTSSMTGKWVLIL